MLTISRPIIVEGKYDKIKVASVAHAVIVQTDGFGIFKNDERAALIRRLAEKNGVIVLTDSDAAGMTIRNYIKNILPADKIINLYTPEVCGKEKRKKAPSKAGLLGVEGTDAEKLREVLRPYSDGGEPTGGAHVTKAELYALGLCGGKNSAEKRKALLRELSLPQTLSANAMLEAVSLTVSPEKWEEAISKISAKEWQKDEVSE